MKKLIIFLLMLTVLHSDDDVRKVVFDLTTDNLQTFEQKVLKGFTAHKTHYEGALKELEIAVMIHGGAYKYFVKDPMHSVFKEDKALISSYDELKKRIAFLVDTYEVEFMMCESGMKRYKLSQKDIYSFVSTVPNAAIGLIDKQNEGYAYIPID